MPMFKNKVLEIARHAGAHRVHKTPTDERIAMTPEDLCEFAIMVIKLQKELTDAAFSDCYNPRRHHASVRGWWNAYCSPETEEELIRRIKTGSPAGSAGKAPGDGGEIPSVHAKLPGER